MTCTNSSNLTWKGATLIVKACPQYTIFNVSLKINLFFTKFKAEVFFLANGRFDINLYSVIKENEVTLLHEYKNVKSGINESNPRFIDIDINDITY